MDALVGIERKLMQPIASFISGHVPEVIFVISS
jgi:hypothetical protein